MSQVLTETDSSAIDSPPTALPAREFKRGIAKTSVALLTAGEDKPYALGIGPALAGHEVLVDFIGSDTVDGPVLHGNPYIRFLNLRGNQRWDASLLVKMRRILKYYARLLRYAATARPKVFHILWNNKFEFFDRTFLMVYYRLLGKRLAFTAHNVNAGKRDSNDSFFNRLSLRIQYSLVHHIFVHTEKMKEELLTDFSVPAEKVSVIPFGINNTLPDTSLTPSEARRKLGLRADDKVMLFFGHIAPYKGLEHLIAAFAELAPKNEQYRLVIAGSVKNCADYWAGIQKAIDHHKLRGRIIEKIGFIPDPEAELFFKAADVLVLPYNHIFQSGVLSLGYSFGLPVIATDVGSLREDIVEGKTGFICEPQNPRALAASCEQFFSSDLYKELMNHRPKIRAFADKKFSWAEVGRLTKAVYLKLLQPYA